MVKRSLAVIGLSMLLSACGFHLRGLEATDFALQSLDVQARDSHGDLQRQVTQALQNGGVQVSGTAPFILDLARQETRERAVSYTSAARSAEYEITSQLTYRILGRNGQPLLTDAIEVQKVYVRDSNNLVGSEREAQQLRDEMNRELTQQLAHRLRLVTPAELERLQHEAQLRARAEAEALRQQRDVPDQAPLQSWPR